MLRTYKHQLLTEGDLINRKKKNSKAIAAMKRSLNQGISRDPLENVNILNLHFASIGNRLVSDLPSSDKSFRDYLPLNVPSCSFVFDPVFSSEIELEIMLTPTNKSHGLYSCPTRLLKCSRHIISASLATLINNSVQRGFFPSKLISLGNSILLDYKEVTNYILLLTFACYIIYKHYCFLRSTTLK